MPKSILPTEATPQPQRRLSRPSLITALGLAGAIALQLSVQSPLFPPVAVVDRPDSKELPTKASSLVSFAFNELKQTLTVLAENVKGDRSIHLPLQRQP